MQQQILGDNVVRIHHSQHYKTLFNQKSGFLVRLEDEGHEEPFWSEDGPELLDLSITNYCERCCDFCYRRANPSGLHMLLNDVENVVKQAKDAGVLQIALGGGNPNQHPHFVDVLRIVRDNGIVPSYTSNGEGLTDDILEATKKYCGAMALSLYYPYERYDQIVERISGMGIKLNLHVILKSDTIELLTEWFKEPPTLFSHINAVIVLNYKPINGSRDLMVKDVGRLNAFYESASACKSVKIGFDSCCISGIVKWMNVPEVLIESCEAARFSCFISEDMKMYPCSFMVSQGWFGDLRKESLFDIWRNNEYFKKFREVGVPERCTGCRYAEVCKGGCRAFEEINFCV